MDNIRIAEELVKVAEDLFYFDKINKELTIQASEELVEIASDLNDFLASEL